MEEKLIRDLYKERNLGKEAADKAAASCLDFENYFLPLGKTWKDVSLKELEGYLENQKREKRLTLDGLLALGRYCYLIKNNDLYTYILRIVWNPELYENLFKRITLLAGKDVSDALLKKITLPDLGSPPSAYPPVTAEIVEALQKALPLEDCKKILTGNLHGIPASSFKEMVDLFRSEPDLDIFLQKNHKRAIKILEEHFQEDKVWFEQIITKRVIKYVKENQEILSGVREGNSIYVTKIPYDPDRFLTETDPVKKRYYACHCPLARESLLKGVSEVPPIWCHCSAGFEKLIFDTLFGEPAEVTVLETVLSGSDRCRFSVEIPGKWVPA